MLRKAWFLPLFLLAASCPGGRPEPTALADLSRTLSGPGGYFDTDNLISNERSYLHAVSDLRAADVRGGVYLGVGPDQNFSYIAEIEPELAIIVDIRRDNVLQHLIYKALFHEARNRLEYLALLTGRPVPDDVAAWSGAELADLLVRLDSLRVDDASRATARRRVREAIEGFGFALSAGERETIDRFHGAFMEAGLELRFRSHGRAPQFYYPTYRELLTEVDREGRPASYVADEERWRRVRRLQLADRVIPVVGDLGGDVALPAIAEHLRARNLEVTAFYTSNVEFYLVGDRVFGAFVRNLASLPLAPGSVLIKSFFRGFRADHPLQVPGYYSTQLVQDANALVRGWETGRYRSYMDVVTRDLVGLATRVP